MDENRRKLLKSMIAAPAILKLGLYMPVKKIIETHPGFIRISWVELILDRKVLTSHVVELKELGAKWHELTDNRSITHVEVSRFSR